MWVVIVTAYIGERLLCLPQLNNKEGGEFKNGSTKFSPIHGYRSKGFERILAGGGWRDWQADTLSMGLLVGGVVMMQHLAAQPSEALLKKCLYAQACPATDECFPAHQQTVGCGTPQNGCNDVNFLEGLCDD